MISLKKIFITGISGCVGHYLFDQLVKEPNYHLYLLVRNPDKMLRKLSDYPNVTVIKDEMRNINQYADVLREMDYVVHLAAGWGESEANYDYTIDFFSGYFKIQIFYFICRNGKVRRPDFFEKHQRAGSAGNYRIP